MNPIDSILQLYRSRPGNFAHLPFGKWFHDAHPEIVDVDLRDSQTISEAKRMILAKGYDCLDFNKLVEYNKRLEIISS